MVSFVQSFGFRWMLKPYIAKCRSRNNRNVTTVAKPE